MGGVAFSISEVIYYIAALPRPTTMGGVAFSNSEVVYNTLT
jgi:hypothetical protein